MSKALFPSLSMPVALSVCIVCLCYPAFAADEENIRPAREPAIEGKARTTGALDEDKSRMDAKALSLLEEKDKRGWISNRLEIGWRAAAVQVDDDSCWHEDTQSGFLGTMAFFEEKDDVNYNNFIIAYHLNDWLGINATWDEVAVTAYTHTDDGHIDGEWKEDGPTLTAVLTTPKIFGFLVPYAEAGFHFPSASYEPCPWWTLGWPSQKTYDKFGAPREARKKYRRMIEASESDSTTFAWGVGLKVYLTDHLVVDVAYRHIDVDETAHFYLMHDDRVTTDSGYYDIPLSYSELCAGVRLAF